jgi:ribosomal protein S12 methylthiotransferase
VDLPLQHLNDAILRRMGRKVTQAQILDLIARLREKVPGVAIRTAFIVGFPGETRAQFEELLGLVERIQFDHLGAFAYSREEGTRAARMRGQLSERTKARRLRTLMLAQRRIVRCRNRALRGKVMEVVIEQGRSNGEVWLARSRTQAPDVDSLTYVRGRRLRPGLFLQVVVTGSRGYDLLARPAP